MFQSLIVADVAIGLYGSWTVTWTSDDQPVRAQRVRFQELATEQLGQGPRLRRTSSRAL